MKPCMPICGINDPLGSTFLQEARKERVVNQADSAYDTVSGQNYARCACFED